MSLLDDARALAPELTDLRHRLHRAPELGLHLPRTQRAVLDALAGLGLDIGTGRSCSSVTAVLRGRAGHPRTPRGAVLLRADMDALPIHEDPALRLRSEIDGAMHACGHDLHTAMLVGAARLLAARRDRLPGDVVLMFQPGEEGYDGARHMIAEGVLDAAGSPPEAAYALHVLSSTAPHGSVTTRPGPLMAASDGLFVTVRGRGGHGSAPHLAADPVPVLCEIVTALQTALTRSVDAFAPVVLTVGRIEAGSRRNVIPDTACLEATVRTFDPAVREQVEAMAGRVCLGVAAAHGVTADVEYRAEYPVTVNDDVEAPFALAVAADLFDDARVSELANPITGSEDFARVLQAVPGAMIFLGACPPGADPMAAASIHSPRAVFDDGVLWRGAALLAGLALRRLARPPA